MGQLQGCGSILVNVVLPASGSPAFLLCQVLFPALGSMVILCYLLVTSKQQTTVRWFNCKEFRQIFYLQICIKSVAAVRAWAILFSSLTGVKWLLLLLQIFVQKFNFSFYMYEAKQAQLLPCQRKMSLFKKRYFVALCQCSWGQF